MNKTGVYPGTFDPATLGHLDLIGRAAKLVDRLVVAVAVNAAKHPLFTVDERVEMLQAELAGTAGVNVLPFDTLLVDFARQQGADLIIRSLRGAADFDYEFQMSGMNSLLDGSIDTIFLPAPPRRHFISSSFVKEVAVHGGDVASFVGGAVHARLRTKFNKG